MVPVVLSLALALLGRASQARVLTSKAVVTASSFSFGRQVEVPMPEHVMPHPDLPGTPASPEQGYIGEEVSHTNFETATGDWGTEYGPTTRKPRPPPPAPAPLPPSPSPPPPPAPAPPAPRAP